MPFIVYEWMVQNVPYFRDKGDSNSSAGWKVCLSSIATFSVEFRAVTANLNSLISLEGIFGNKLSKTSIL